MRDKDDAGKFSEARCLHRWTDAGDIPWQSQIVPRTGLPLGATSRSTCLWEVSRSGRDTKIYGDQHCRETTDRYCNDECRCHVHYVLNPGPAGSGWDWLGGLHPPSAHLCKGGKVRGFHLWTAVATELVDPAPTPLAPPLQGGESARVSLARCGGDGAG